jgi:D-arabinose 1-dehydrogenase-like Zn-dependent alcohol dehydrogenase
MSCTTTQTITSSFASLKVVEKSIATTKITEVSLPLTQRALTVASKHTYRVDDSFPVPEIQNGDEVVIKTCAVGLNPIDWKSVDWNFCLPAFPWVTGREMSGVVAQVGENVTEFKEGDRVWTSELISQLSNCLVADLG